MQLPLPVNAYLLDFTIEKPASLLEQSDGGLSPKEGWRVLL
jgi:hypothetical protein